MAEQINQERRQMLLGGAATLSLGAGLALLSQQTLAQGSQENTVNAAADLNNLPVIEAELTQAPNVPKPLNRNYAAKVVVKLTAYEKILDLMDGVQFKFWTLEGAVPAPFIRVREGDLVEIQLANSASSMMAHSLDLHAAQAPAGGAEASTTPPGTISSFTFKALRSGLYLYHCGSQPVAVHLAKGMYGLILVEPKEGLPKVDREYYIMQSEFYTKGAFGEAGVQPFSMEKAIDERPDYVLFNGKVGSMMGDNALTAKTGEHVRLFLGNAGPNLASSFHLIGAVFDNVYVEGGTLLNHNVQTTLIPAGGATIVESRIDVPGSYTFMDHSIFRAFHKGTMGQLVVDGDENKAVYSGQQSLTPFEEKNPQAPVAAPYEIEAHKNMKMAQ